MVCQNSADSLDNGGSTETIMEDFSKTFDLVPHHRMLTKIAASGVDSRVVALIEEFLLGSTERVRVGGQLSDDVRVLSGVVPMPKLRQLAAGFPLGQLGSGHVGFVVDKVAGFLQVLPLPCQVFQLLHTPPPPHHYYPGLVQ
jgi:hypothetical protein